jgi:hypothetical protein
LGRSGGGPIGLALLTRRRRWAARPDPETFERRANQKGAPSEAMLSRKYRKKRPDEDVERGHSAHIGHLDDSTSRVARTQAC